MITWPEPFPTVEIDLYISRTTGDLNLEVAEELCRGLEAALTVILKRLDMVAELCWVPNYTDRVHLDPCEGHIHMDESQEPADVPSGFKIRKSVGGDCG